MRSWTTVMERGIYNFILYNAFERDNTPQAGNIKSQVHKNGKKYSFMLLALAHCPPSLKETRK